MVARDSPIQRTGSDFVGSWRIPPFEQEAIGVATQRDVERRGRGSNASNSYRSMGRRSRRANHALAGNAKG